MKKNQNKNKECKTGEYKTNEVVTHGPLICFGGFGQPRCKFLYVCTKENNMRFKEKCDSCGERKFCETVHVDKDVTQRWCKKCRDEEENMFKNITEADRTGRLLTENKYLKNKKIRDRLLKRTTISSAEVEGIEEEPNEGLEGFPEVHI